MAIRSFFIFTCFTFFVVSCSKKNGPDETPPPTPPPAPPTSVPLAQVYYGNDTIGSWKEMYRDTSARFNDIQFPTPDVGYLGNNYYFNIGWYRKSTDSGRTWSKDQNLQAEANTIQFITKDIGFSYRSSLPSNLGRGLVPLEQTPNGGAGWRVIFRSTYTYTTVKKLVFPSTNKGYAITEIGEFVTLNNPFSPNGITTQVVANISSNDVFDFHFSDLKNGWMITEAKTTFLGGEGFAILNTSDSGKTWVKQFEDLDLQPSSYFSIFFSDQNNGWASTGKQMIYRTVDGGKSWTKLTITKPDGSRVTTYKIIFVNSQKGFLISTNEVLETSDGGLTWRRSLKDGQDYIEDIYYNNSGFIWAISASKLFRLSL